MTTKPPVSTPSLSTPTRSSEPVPHEPEGQIESADLFKGRREVVIRHNQDRYVLRITRQGKLILNK